MLNSRFSLIPLACVALLACSPGEAPQDSGAGAPAPAADDSYDIDALVAAADLNRGRTQFILCQSCHSLNEGGPNKVGPNLWGVMDREAAQAPGFNYSDALKNAGVVWTNEALDQFLKRPSEFVPGNSMVFVGVERPSDRAALIAWVRQQTTSAAQ